ncbi:MAG: helix-turn-helix domain-containing protein, partial [Steroidobacteraceae bacterium]
GDLPARYRPADWMPCESNIEALDETLNERAALTLLEVPSQEHDISQLPADGIDLRAHIASVEETLIRQALTRSNGTVAQAARLLGLRRTTLVEKLRKFEISSFEDSAED